MDITHIVTSSGVWLALSSFMLLSGSAATSFCARSAQTMPGQRKWSTISLSAVALDYLVKYGVIGSGADLAGLVSFTIVTSRSGLLWRLNFSDKDTSSRKALQQGISWITFAFCVGLAYASQIAVKGSFDPYSLLVLAGNGFACLADSLNVVTWRRRSHFMMAWFMLAFGICTGSWTLMAKASIDLGACVFFDPLFGEHRRERVMDALRSILAPRLRKHAAVEPR